METIDKSDGSGEVNLCLMQHSNGVPHLHTMAINKFSVFQIAVSCFYFILCCTCIEVDSLPLTIYRETKLEMKNEPLNRTDARSFVMLCILGSVLLILMTTGAIFCVHVINTLDRQLAEINAMIVSGWCRLFFSRLVGIFVFLGHFYLLFHNNE